MKTGQTTGETATFIDLASLDTVKACNKPYRLELLHPITKEGLGQYIHVLGRDSDRCREWSDEKFDREQREASENARAGNDPIIKSRQRIRDEAIETLAAATVDFENVHFDGAVLPFSITNAKMLYSRLTWAKDQVDSAIVKLENFMPA